MPSAQPAAAAAAGGVCCVHPTISNGDSATAHTLRQGKQMNGVVRTKRDGMLRFRLQGQVHFLRARIKGIADELTPARYLVGTLTVPCRRYLNTLHRCKCCKTRQNPKQEAVSGEANGRESDAATVPNSCCCGNYSTDTNIQLASSFSFSLYLNKVWLNSI